MKTKSLYDSFKTHKEDFETILLCNYAEQNKTLYWKASDTENKFKTKLREKPEAVSYWKDKSIEYRYNNYGFRTYDDFNKDDEGIVCLGCSFTEGIGLPLEYNWGYKLAKHFNLKHWNLGQHAMGLETAFRLLLGVSDWLKFKKVFLFVPPFYRNELIVSDNDFIEPYLTEASDVDKGFIHSMGGEVDPHIFSSFEPKVTRFYESILYGSRLNERLRMIRNLCSIQGLCKQLGVEFYYQTFSNHFTKKANQEAYSIPDNECIDIPARDQHWSTKRQHLIFKKFIQLYENNNR